MANGKTRSQAQRARTRDRRSAEDRQKELEYLRKKHGGTEGQAAFETAMGMSGYVGSAAELEARHDAGRLALQDGEGR